MIKRLKFKNLWLRLGPKKPGIGGLVTGADPRGRDIRCKAEAVSIQPCPEIGPVGFAAALLVPGPGALFDQFDFGLALRFWNRTPDGDFFLSQEAVVIDFHRVHLAGAAEIERLDVFISHDSAGNGRHGSFPPLSVKFLTAF
jgi:diadenosine tetraphosphatase ApaH/serine/threonine PP2A family protein phosphatase